MTANAKTIRSIPLRIKEGEEKGKKQSPLLDGSMKEVEARGEVYLPNDVFERINRERAESELSPFANPRNAASGAMRQLDPCESTRPSPRPIRSTRSAT